MQLHYSLDPQDFLQYHLFAASHNKRLRAKRKKAWLVISACLLFLALLSYSSNENFLALLLLIYGIITLIFYPFFQRYHYKKSYEKYIKEHYKNRFGKLASLEIKDDIIETTDSASETKMYLSEIDGITETGEYFFLIIKSGGHYIIPKRKISKLAELKGFLQSLSQKLNIPYAHELNWKWK